MHALTPERLDGRIRRLERTNGLLLAAFLCLPLLGAFTRGPERAEERLDRADQVAEILQARRIQIVDHEGRVRIDLRHDDEETGVFVIDDVGDTRLGAAHFAHGGGGYALHGPAGRGAAVLYLDGAGSLTFYDSEGGVTARYPEASR